RTTRGDPMRHLAHVDEEALLGRLHLPLRHALASCLRFARTTNTFSIAVHGSLSCDEADEFSDLDLSFAYDAGPSAAQARSSFEAMIGGIGAPVARFDGSHVHSSDTHVIYLSCLDWIVKLDARVIAATRGLLPIKSRILYDPPARFRAFDLEPPPVIDA